MARGGFLSGPTGVHGTQKIRKHVLKRGVTRDMNSAAGALVNTKIPYLSLIHISEPTRPY